MGRGNCARTARRHHPFMNKRLLMVKDSSEVEELAAKISQIEGCVVDQSNSNLEAKALAESTSYDVVLTGVGGTLNEKLSFLEASNGHRRSRVIFLGAEPSPGDLTAAMRHGAFSYFTAPFQSTCFQEI